MMSSTDPLENLPDELGDQIGKLGGDYHDRKMGEYHPSSITGCPLGVLLDFMTEKHVPQNHYMFSGSAVHYHMQEEEVIDRALHRCGFHHLNVEHEVPITKEVAPGVNIVGRCDTVARSDDESVAIDLKYTSLKPHYNNGRLTKYAAQVNTYANMLGCDRWALLFIYSKSDDITQDCNIMTGETNTDVWDLVVKRANQIHSALDHFGYGEGNRWSVDMLKNEKGEDFWEEVMEFFDEDDVPSYSAELKYSDRDEWVMPYMDDWGVEKPKSGLASFKS